MTAMAETRLRPNPGAGHLIQVFHVSDEKPITGDMKHSMMVIKEEDGVRRQSQVSKMMWDAGVLT